MALTLNNDLSSLKVGDYFWCHYTAPTSGQIGTFSDIATKTDAEATPVIPVASSATPTGYFKYIVVDDYNGKKKLIADRDIQHSISWDVLNTNGIASGSGLPMIFDVPKPENYAFSIRLLNSGVSSVDIINEWNKYIVDSNLIGNIVAGDNGIWNWSSVSSWTSTSSSTSANRVIMGNSTQSKWTNGSTITSQTNIGFRPVLEIESIFTLLNKSFILKENKYKNRVNKKWNDVSSTLPTLTQFQNDGIDDLSTLNRMVQLVDDSPQVMIDNGVLGVGKVYKGTVDLTKYFDLRKLEVK